MGKGVTIPSMWILVGLVLVFTVPVFRSGDKGRLTFAIWLKNHTIWGEDPMYVPYENPRGSYQGCV